VALSSNGSASRAIKQFKVVLVEPSHFVCSGNTRNNQEEDQYKFLLIMDRFAQRSSYALLRSAFVQTQMVVARDHAADSKIQAGSDGAWTQGFRPLMKMDNRPRPIDGTGSVGAGSPCEM
jgi:hypothetical protein